MIVVVAVINHTHKLVHRINGGGGGGGEDARGGPGHERYQSPAPAEVDCKALARHCKTGTPVIRLWKPAGPPS